MAAPDEPTPAYGLAPLPEKPSLPGTVLVSESADACVDAVAADLLIHAKNCVRAFGDFHLALAGGPMTSAVLVRLMIDPNFRDLPWKRTNVWLAHERRVEFQDERSTFKLVSEVLADHADVPRDQIHPVFPQSEDADRTYERRLRESLAWREPGHDRLDYVMLPLSESGHLPGLSPGSPAVGASSDRLVVAHDEDGSPGHVVMTDAMVRAARFVGVLAWGEERRAGIARLSGLRADRQADIASMPVLGVVPHVGELRWYLDKGACPAPARAE